MAKGSSGKSRRCDAAVATGDPALPVSGTGVLSHVRKSRTGKWRGAVLAAVNLLIVAHATQYFLGGRTVSPVEPSEAMYTLELGEVNAGFVFLVLALASTLIFGRFVCGWGCHLIALQDLCGWIMKKLGIRPRPFRSRLLLWVPVGLAFYMFVWPTLRRVVFESSAGAFPGFSNHLMTDTFWKTFPGPVIATLTLLTCGFAAVYFLGSKGFCAYGCPYGALFGAMDRLAPGGILVNDDCEQCGHCTVTCSSNVLVHEEVRRYGRVVDPGCMKCMDCVSVCPKGALSFRFAMPSFLRRASGPRKVRRYTYGFGTEAVLLGVCAAATLAFRGLYDGPSLLMAVGLGGITAFVALKLWYLLRRPAVGVQNLRLKVDGKISTAGHVFAVLASVWLAFCVHSGFVQWHRAWGRYHLDRTEATRAEVLSGAFLERDYSDRHGGNADELFHHFALADRWGLASVVEVELGLAWGHLLRNELGEAEQRIRAAVALAPAQVRVHENLVEFLVSRGRIADATVALRAKIGQVEPTAGDLFTLGGWLAGAGSLQEAAECFSRASVLAPDNPAVRFNHGGVLRRLDRNREAIEQLIVAAGLAPTDADVWIELGLAHASVGDTQEALDALRTAIRLAPDSPESKLHLPAIVRELEEAAP